MKLTPNERKVIDRRMKRGCMYCGTRENLTIDHKHPKVMGGTDSIKNLQVLCGRCNRIKSGIPHNTVRNLFVYYETSVRGTGSIINKVVGKMIIKRPK